MKKNNNNHKILQVSAVVHLYSQRLLSWFKLKQPLFDGFAFEFCYRTNINPFPSEGFPVDE